MARGERASTDLVSVSVRVVLDAERGGGWRAARDTLSMHRETYLHYGIFFIFSASFHTDGIASFAGDSGLITHNLSCCALLSFFHGSDVALFFAAERIPRSFFLWDLGGLV
jgi:hypothetical protein